MIGDTGGYQVDEEKLSGKVSCGVSCLRGPRRGRTEVMGSH